MKKFIVIAFATLLLGQSSAHAFLGTTFGMFSSLYETVSDYTVDFMDDILSDYETSSLDDSFLFSAPLDTNPNSGVSNVPANSCQPADFTWCPYCSWGWDVINNLFSGIGETLECSRNNFISKQQTLDDQGNIGTPKSLLDEGGYCACLDNKSFPEPTSRDIIKNLVEQKKKEMVSEIFEEYQDVAKSLQNIAINPEYAKLIESDKDLCLPGNFAKIEASLFDSGSPKSPAPCGEEARDLMKDALQTEIEEMKDNCLAGWSSGKELPPCAKKKPWLIHRQSTEEYNAMVDDLGDEGKSKDKGIDSKSLGSWFDFQLKKEFDDAMMKRLEINPAKARSNEEIYKGDFEHLGAGFHEDRRNVAIAYTKAHSRTPDQELSFQLAGFIKNGGACAEEEGCALLYDLISQQEEFIETEAYLENKIEHDVNKGSPQKVVQAYLNFMQAESEKLHSRLQAHQQALERRPGNEREVTEDNSSVPSLVAIGGEALNMSIRALGTVANTNQSENKSLTHEGLYESIQEQQKVLRKATLSKLRGRCSRLMEQTVNFCRVVKNQGNFDAGQLLGLTSRKQVGTEAGPDGRPEPVYEDVANFKNIGKLVEEASPSYGADGKPLLKSEKDQAKVEIQQTLDQLACYESNQMPSMKVDDEQLKDHPPFYQTDGSWISCVKTVNRTVQFRGENRTVRYCCQDEACKEGNGDHEIRDHEDIELRKMGMFLEKNFDISLLAISSEEDETAAIIETIVEPKNQSSSTYTGSGGKSNSCLYCSVDGDKYKYKYSKKPSSYDNAYYNSIAGGGSSKPEKYDDFVKRIQKNGSLASDATSVTSKTQGKTNTIVASDQLSGDTVVNRDAAETAAPLSDFNNRAVSNDRLQQIDRQIISNNQIINQVDETVSQAEKKLVERENDISAGPEDEKRNAILDELKILREQIEALKKDNERLALERKQEIEKVKQEQEEKRRRVAESKEANIIGSSNVVNDIAVPAGNSAIVTKGSNGSDSVNNMGSNDGGVISSNGGNQATPVNRVEGTASSPTSISSLSGTGVSKSGSGIVLTAVGSNGEQINFNSNEVLNLEGRADVTSFENALSIALKAEKSAFVYGGKYFVKKGENYVQVSNIKEMKRAVASQEIEIKSVEDVEQLLESYKPGDNAGEDKTDAELIPKPTPSSVDLEKPSSSPASEENEDASKRERSYVEKLWNIFDTAGRNLFSF